MTMKRQAAIAVVSALVITISVCCALAQAAPPCTGRNPNVAVPSAPHGMFAWASGERMDNLLKKYVIGKDPTLCGASIVVKWADVEKSKGSFDFSPAEDLAKPFTDAGLAVNFLFAEATEGKDEVTPRW